PPRRRPRTTPGRAWSPSQRGPSRRRRSAGRRAGSRLRDRSGAGSKARSSRSAPRCDLGLRTRNAAQRRGLLTDHLEVPRTRTPGRIVHDAGPRIAEALPASGYEVDAVCREVLLRTAQHVAELVRDVLGVGGSPTDHARRAALAGTTALRRAG